MISNDDECKDNVSDFFLLPKPRRRGYVLETSSSFRHDFVCVKYEVDYDDQKDETAYFIAYSVIFFTFSSLMTWIQHLCSVKRECFHRFHRFIPSIPSFLPFSGFVVSFSNPPMKITEEHVESIRKKGYVIVNDFLGKELSSNLRSEIVKLSKENAMSRNEVQFGML